MLNKSNLDFVSIIEHGIDVAYHRKHLVPNLLNDYYIHIDKKIGEIINRTNKNSKIIIVSEHGHESPKELDHIYIPIDGILIAKGPGIKKNYRIKNASILDIVPTILYMFNLSIPRNMDGNPLLEMFTKKYNEQKNITYINTYGKEFEHRSFSNLTTMNKSPFNQEIYKRLKK